VHQKKRFTGTNNKYDVNSKMHTKRTSMCIETTAIYLKRRLSHSTSHAYTYTHTLSSTRPRTHPHTYTHTCKHTHTHTYIPGSALPASAAGSAAVAVWQPAVAPVG